MSYGSNRVRTYIGKARMERLDLFMQTMQAMGFTLKADQGRIYNLGPPCEREQRFFLSGCLQMWTAAEKAGHLPTTPQNS